MIFLGLLSGRWYPFISEAIVFSAFFVDLYTVDPVYYTFIFICFVKSCSFTFVIVN